MSNNQIEHHLEKPFVSNTEATKVTADDTIVLASTSSVHKMPCLLYLCWYRLKRVAVASQARGDIVVSAGELLLESDVEKFNT